MRYYCAKIIKIIKSMARYDLRKLRTAHNITQKELADRLKVSQGFLSSVEKWRNPFPDDRVDDLQTSFPDVDLSDFEVAEENVPKGNMGSFNKYSDIDINDSKVLSRLLELINRSSSSVEQSRETAIAEISDWRTRYDNLSKDNEQLRNENYSLKNEILRLKELLLDNGISYKKEIDTQ